MKISFDFDDTLSKEYIQKLAKKFIEKNHNVYIITARVNEEEWNKDIYKLANELNIPKANILITDGQFKWHYLEDFDIHFDDDIEEIDKINNKLKKCVGVLV